MKHTVYRKTNLVYGLIKGVPLWDIYIVFSEEVSEKRDQISDTKDHVPA